jgi:hypothetical protein
MRPPRRPVEPCRGPSPNRRDLLRAGVIGSLGLTLDDFLRLRAAAADDPGSPRARACILVWQAGGPSHLDTFDPKPDAPADVRGEFKPIATGISGVFLSEVYPKLAATLRHAALVRSVTSPEVDHDRAAHHLLTGYRPSPALVYPSYGSVAARLREGHGGTLPPYVAVPEAPLFSSSGYLTPAYDPFAVGSDPNSPNFRVRDLTPPDRLTLDRLNRRRRMVGQLDEFAKDVPPTPLTASRDRFAAQAYDLLTSNAAQAAFQIGTESPALREAYGRSPVGHACLLARRLVEAGVAFVTVNDRGMGQLGWDTHAQNFNAIKANLAPPIDQAVAALVEDLRARGLLETTLVVMMGEFGRTPKINGNAGRDHHGRASSVLLAGGGLASGVVVGRTDSTGDSPADRPVTPSDLAATIYHALGIDPTRQFESPDGQPIRLVDTGQPIAELVDGGVV